MIIYFYRKPDKPRYCGSLVSAMKMKATYKFHMTTMLFYIPQNYDHDRIGYSCHIYYHNVSAPYTVTTVPPPQLCAQPLM